MVSEVGITQLVEICALHGESNANRVAERITLSKNAAKRRGVALQMLSQKLKVVTPIILTRYC